MKRREFIQNLSLITIGMSTIPTKLFAEELKSFPDKDYTMPVLFMGHGSPMNAIEDNYFTKGWATMVKDIPTPTAIVCISAHWETKGTKVLSSPNPKMIYDMGGFPKELYEVKYPAEGSPKLAELISTKVTSPKIEKTTAWGFDHGTWSVLVKSFPKANIPLIQLSIDHSRDMQYHYDLAKQLAFLRKKGVLVIGSGNIVHNLPQIFSTGNKPADWALDFDNKIAELTDQNDFKSIINYKQFGRGASLSVNSAEHFLPFLYTLALRNKKDKVKYYNHEDKSTLLGIGMRCVKFY